MRILIRKRRKLQREVLPAVPQSRLSNQLLIRETYREDPLDVETLKTFYNR